MIVLDIILLSLWVIPVAIGIVYMRWSNKEDAKIENQPPALLDDNHLRWEDLDFQREQQPVVESNKDDNSISKKN